MLDPIQAKHLEMMRAMAGLLDKAFPDHGFCLMVFDFGEGGTMNYISNAKRADMLKALDEFKQRILNEQP